MKKLILYTIVIVTALLAPMERSDVGKLIPVQTVFVYKEDEAIVIETETGNRGIGDTVDSAIQDLHETAAGLIFLDTAEYLLVSEDAVGVTGEMERHLKEKTKVCRAEPGIDLIAATGYLTVHQPKTSLKTVKIGGIAEKIQQNMGRIIMF